MNIASLLLRTQSSSILSRSLSKRLRTSIILKNAYATHPDTEKSSLLSQSLDTKQRASAPRADSVGPFQLGLGQSSLKKGEKVHKWSELSTGGKGMSRVHLFNNLVYIYFLSDANNGTDNKLNSDTARRGAVCAINLLSHIGTVFQKLANCFIRRCL